MDWTVEGGKGGCRGTTTGKDQSQEGVGRAEGAPGQDLQVQRPTQPRRLLEARQNRVERCSVGYWM